LFAEGTGGRKREWGNRMKFGSDCRLQSMKRISKGCKSLPLAIRRAAQGGLGYYTVYPQEIDRLIEQNEQWNEEKVRERYPL